MYSFKYIIKIIKKLIYKFINNILSLYTFKKHLFIFYFLKKNNHNQFSKEIFLLFLLLFLGN